MITTSQWPEVTLDVLKQIQLDPKNVRLKTPDAKVEADILWDLFVNEDALSLVEAICKVGYLTHDIPVVVKRDDTYVMVEGNRRLAALKAIQNPMLIPQYQARITALASRLPNRSVMAKIRVMIAPSQDEADQLIAAIHTGNMRRPWTPARQAAFFQAQIDAGRQYKDLVDRYPTIDVKKFVFRAHVINLFKAVEYDSQEDRNFLATKQWARGLSTLARIYESKAFLDLTGLTMDGDGRVTKTISNEVFKEMATIIIRGMRDGNINTRSLNSVKSPRYVQLMAELKAIATADCDIPADKSAGSYSEASAPAVRTGHRAAPSDMDTTGHAIDDRTPKSAQRTDPTTAKPPRFKPHKFLDISQVKAPPSYPTALKYLLAELSALDVQRFPNIAFLALRASLEKSIKAFAEASSIDINAEIRNPSGRVQLRQALLWLLKYVKKNGPNHLIQCIESIRTGKIMYVTTKDALDAINHNHHFMVDSSEVIAMWDSIDSIMRYLMKPRAPR